MQKLALTPSLRLLAAIAGVVLMRCGARGRGYADMSRCLGGVGLLFLAFAAQGPEPSEAPKDIVDIASEDSFPASDPPSTW